MYRNIQICEKIHVFQFCNVFPYYGHISTSHCESNLSCPASRPSMQTRFAWKCMKFSMEFSSATVKAPTCRTRHSLDLVASARNVHLWRKYGKNSILKFDMLNWNIFKRAIFNITFKNWINIPFAYCNTTRFRNIPRITCHETSHGFRFSFPSAYIRSHFSLF